MLAVACPRVSSPIEIDLEVVGTAETAAAPSTARPIPVKGSAQKSDTNDQENSLLAGRTGGSAAGRIKRDPNQGSCPPRRPSGRQPRPSPVRPAGPTAACPAPSCPGPPTSAVIRRDALQPITPDNRRSRGGNRDDQGSLRHHPPTRAHEFHTRSTRLRRVGQGLAKYSSAGERRRCLRWLERGREARPLADDPDAVQRFTAQRRRADGRPRGFADGTGPSRIVARRGLAVTTRLRRCL